MNIYGGACLHHPLELSRNQQIDDKKHKERAFLFSERPLLLEEHGVFGIHRRQQAAVKTSPCGPATPSNIAAPFPSEAMQLLSARRCVGGQIHKRSEFIPVG